MPKPHPDTFPKSLMIGVPEIDDEHAAIFRRIHEMAAALAKSDAGSKRESFRSLIDAFAAHFDHEEQVMAKAGYRNIARHKKHHAEFIARLERLAAKGDGARKDAIEAHYDALDTLFRDALKGDTEFANWLLSR